MKRMLISISLLIFLSMLIVSCQKEVIQKCQSDNLQQIETFYNDEFENNSCILQNIDIDAKVVNLVIKSQADFEKYLFCNTHPQEINFEKYFVLAGRYRHNQCAIFDRQEVAFCDNRIIYRVWMLEQICAAVTNVYYFVVIDREYENRPIVFDVKFSI